MVEAQITERPEPCRAGAFSVETIFLGASNRTHQVAVQAADDVERDALGARSRALTNVGAATEAFSVHLLNHAEHTRVAFSLTLRK